MKCVPSLMDFGNDDKINEALIVRMKMINNNTRVDDESELLIPNIYKDSSAAFNIFMVFDKYTFKEAQDEGIITEEEIKRVTENNPVIIHGGNDGKLICSGSAFLLHPWFNRPQESQTLYFATARHNLCKQILNNHVIKLSTMYVTEHVQTDVFHQDIGLNDYDKILATPLLKKDVESLMCTSDPDITFFKIHLDGFFNHRMAFEFFSKARYFIPKSITQLSTIKDESFNVGIACVFGKWRDVDFER